MQECIENSGDKIFWKMSTWKTGWWKTGWWKTMFEGVLILQILNIRILWPCTILRCKESIDWVFNPFALFKPNHSIIKRPTNVVLDLRLPLRQIHIYGGCTNTLSLVGTYATIYDGPKTTQILFCTYWTKTDNDSYIIQYPWMDSLAPTQCSELHRTWLIKLQGQEAYGKICRHAHVDILN
jgi:hypothetical protein